MTGRRCGAVGVLLVCCLAHPPSLEAQGQNGWTAYWENDSFVAGGGSDRSYTNGVRLVWGADDAPRNTMRGRFEGWWQRFTPLLRSGTFVHTTSAWAMGQNFFTPATITVYPPDPNDRPYAGLAYGGLRVDAQDDATDLRLNQLDRWDRTRVRFQHSLELDVGILGAAAGAETFQTFAHVLRVNRIPKGWKNQLPHEPYLSANTMWRARIGRHWLDVTPHAGAMLGTVQAYPYAGATLRVGWNLTDFPSLLVRANAIPARTRPEWEFGLLTGVEGRWMPHNAFVAGGLRTDSDGLDAEKWVGDWRFGFTLRLTDWRLTWTQVRRSPELADETLPIRRYHKYGSVSFGYEPGRTTPEHREGTVVGWLADELLGTVFRGFMIEAGTGPADAVGAESALGSRVGAHWRLAGDRYAVGIEFSGIGREFGPPPLPVGDHEDLFLVNLMPTVRVIPFGRLGPGRLHVRAGLGSGKAKRQVTPGVPGERTGACPAGFVLDSADDRYCNRTETGLGVGLGVGYWFAMPGDQASLGVDWAWNRLGLEEPVQYSAVTVGFQWHPR